MNTLKKNIIYHYIIITFVLLILEIYLYKLLFAHLEALERITGVPWMAFEVLGLLAGIALFGLFSYGYYRRVSKCIAEETERQVRERNLLFANIAHDLKNPIASVLGLARALESGAVEETEQQAIYRTISSKSLQVDEMIQKLFRYAKMESEGYSLSLAERDVCGMVRECTALRYNEIEVHKIELEMDIPDEPVLCSVDITEFPRVIDNLISNAIKHNGDGIRLLVAVKTDGGKTEIIVADSGRNIPENMRAAVFEPFQCSDESRTAKDGSGLGLAIARRIAVLHGGRLYIDSNIPDYTKAFVFEL